MSKALDSLKPAFRDKAVQLIAATKAAGVVMVPAIGLRSALQQARLWRQGRSTAQINAEIASLRQKGAPFIASLIEKVGPQNGGKVTNAVPGQGWHNWGLALDCYPNGNGNAPMSAYAVYATEGKKLGLNMGYFWGWDGPHAELHWRSPLKEYGSWPALDAALKAAFPNGE